MTLEEYKASPSSWNPTFTVANLEDYTKWQNRAEGNDYERVLVAGNVTAAAGIDLSYSQTKQVVFNDGVTLTLELNELEGRCIYRSLKEDGAELWLYKPRVSATNSHSGFHGEYVGGHLYCFWHCNNIESPTVESAATGNATGSTASSSSYRFYGGHTYCFYYCNNINNAVVKSAATGNMTLSFTGSYSNYNLSVYNGSVYCFYYCRNIQNPTVEGASGGKVAVNPSANIASNTYAYGGSAYCFYCCGNIESPTVENANGGTASNAGSSYNGTRYSGDVFCFYYCENVFDPKATVAAGNGNVYMNRYWSGLIINRAGSVAATGLFYPDYGPCYLLLSDDPRPGMPVTLSWAFITSNGTPVSKNATLSASFDGGASWSTVYSGANTSCAYTVPSGKDGIMFRVGSGTSTGYCTTETVPFTAAPVISGTDANLGVMADAFSPYQYSVARSSADTEEWDEAAVTVTLDGGTLQSAKAAVNIVKTVLIGAAEWKKVPNGEHTLKISARRIVGGVSFGTAAVRTLTFTRTKNRAVLTLRNAARSDTRPEQIMLSVAGAFPSGSSLSVEACNNANDSAPAWEDMTAECLAGTPRAFANGTKTAGEWGVNFRITLERGTAVGDCYINAVSGEYS